MTRRSFITSTLQSLALVGALKLGLGNMTSEDVRLDKWQANNVWVYYDTFTQQVRFLRRSELPFIP